MFLPAVTLCLCLTAASGSQIGRIPGTARSAPQLLQTRLTISRTHGEQDAEPAAPELPVAGPAAELPPGPATAAEAERHATDLFWPLAALAFTCLAFAAPALARVLEEDADPAAAETKGKAPEGIASPSMAILDSCMVALALAVESTISAITVPLLPQLAGPSAVALFFAKPIVGITVSVLLPFLLVGRGLRSVRLLAVTGLLLLSPSCLGLATASSFEWLLASRMLGALSSGLIFASLLYGAMVQPPVERTGWRLCGALYGLSIGAAGGPWIGGVLADACGGTSGMLYVLSPVAMGTACTIAALSEWTLARSDMVVQPASMVFAQHRAAFDAGCDLLRDPKRRTLLAGVGIVAAVLSLQSTLLPLYMTGISRTGTLPDVMGWDCIGGATFGLALLATGLWSDSLREWQVATSLVASVAAAGLGLRTLVCGRQAAHPAVALAGYLAASGGIGQCLGLAVPLLARLSRSISGLPLPAPTAVVSAAIPAAWMLGDMLAVTGQIVLRAFVGNNWTIYGFAGLLAAYAAAVLLVPGWLQSPSASQKANFAATWAVAAPVEKALVEDLR